MTSCASVSRRFESAKIGRGPTIDEVVSARVGGRMENSRRAVLRGKGPTGQPTWIHRSQRKNTVKLRTWFWPTASIDDFGWEPAKEYRLPADAQRLTEALQGTDE